MTRQAQSNGPYKQVCLLDTMLYLEDGNGNLAYTDDELWGDMNDIMAWGLLRTGFDRH